MKYLSVGYGLEIVSSEKHSSQRVPLFSDFEAFINALVTYPYLLCGAAIADIKCRERNRMTIVLRHEWVLIGLRLCIPSSILRIYRKVDNVNDVIQDVFKRVTTTRLVALFGRESSYS